MAELPVVLTKEGMQPIPPTDLWRQLLAAVAAIVPGYTANLPGGLIEDISSTDVAAIALCDSARVELINSLTPYGANEWLLAQLGQVYGVRVGDATNTSVQVIFNGPPGFVIRQGFTVSDGVYEYQCRSGGIIGAGGQSPPLTFIAVDSGSWEIPPGTVTQIATSVPASIGLTCSNLQAGIPGLVEETPTNFRARVLQAGLAAGVGMPSYVRTVVGNVSGVVQRLISVRQTQSGNWKVIVGGGDVFEVARALYESMLDISSLTGSELAIADISTSGNAVVTTNFNHGFSNGEIVYASDVRGMDINGVPLTVTVLDQKRFSTGVSSVLRGRYASGGVLTPNRRNVVVSISDFPDVYRIQFVSPPRQIVSVTIQWGTLAPNFVNSAAVAQLGARAVSLYVNQIPVGLPINVYDLQRVFLDAVSSVIDPQLVSTLIFSISIDGVGVAPQVGTGLVIGDPESYLATPDDASLINVEQI